MSKITSQLSLAVVSLLLAFAVAGPAAAKFTAQDAAKLDSEAAATLAEFKKNTMGGSAVLDAAKGVLVCSKITKAGVIVGVEGGYCVLTSGASDKI